jgi:hypothetical protein
MALAIPPSELNPLLIAPARFVSVLTPDTPAPIKLVDAPNVEIKLGIIKSFWYNI